MKCKFFYIFILLFIFFGQFFTVCAEDINDFKIYFIIKSTRNFFKNKYDISIYFDGTSIGIIKNGENFKKVVITNKGNHTVTFTASINKEKTNKYVFKEEKTINLVRNISFSCDIHKKTEKFELKNESFNLLPSDENLLVSNIVLVKSLTPTPIPTNTPTITPTPPFLYGVVNNPNDIGIIMYDGPSMNSTVIRSIANKSTFEYLGERKLIDNNTWIKIKTEDGYIGWVYESLIMDSTKFGELQTATAQFKPTRTPYITPYKPTPINQSYSSPYKPTPKKKWWVTPSISYLDKVYKDNDGKCLIKGNIGKNGRIYHLPNCRMYNRTNAERYFCTIREAQNAGYVGCDLE